MYVIYIVSIFTNVPIFAMFFTPPLATLSEISFCVCETAFVSPPFAMIVESVSHALN